MIGIKFVRRCYHFFAYRIYVKRKISRTDTSELFGLTITIPPTVFHPSLYFTSTYIGTYINGLDLKNKRVLDMGCGSGILSLIAASKEALVTGIDINPKAIIATKNNAGANNLQSRVSVHEGNLFEDFSDSDRFDYIFFNPPFYRGEQVDDSQYAWKAGANFEVTRSFIEGAKFHLTKGGVIIIILSTETDYQRIISLFEEHHYTVSLVLSKRVLFEKLFIYRITTNS